MHITTSYHKIHNSYITPLFMKSEGSKLHLQGLFNNYSLARHLIGTHKPWRVFFFTSWIRQDPYSVFLCSAPPFPRAFNIPSASWPVLVYHQWHSFAIHSRQMFSILFGLVNFIIYFIYTQFLTNFLIWNEISSRKTSYPSQKSHFCDL